MAGSVNFWWAMQYRGAGPGPLPKLGDFETAVNVPVASDLKYLKDFSVAAAAKATLFDATTDLADFDFLLIVTDDADVMVELVTDQNAGVGRVVSTLQLYPGLPLILGGDNSYANYAINFAAGTLDVIDLIRAKNIGSDTVVVSCFAAT